MPALRWPTSACNVTSKSLCRCLGAYCATTPDGKWSFPTQSPYYLGTIGIMGHESVARQLATARQVVVLGGHPRANVCDVWPGRPFRNHPTWALSTLVRPYPGALSCPAICAASWLNSNSSSAGAVTRSRHFYLPGGVLFREPTRDGVETDIVDAPWVLQTIQPTANSMDIFVDAGNTGAYWPALPDGK